MKIFQVDAFGDGPFTGNPASVVPLSSWLEDETMQNIAMENNQAETAFIVQRGDIFEIRWFTPALEVDLCGHATLASAHVLFEHLGFDGDEVVFDSPRTGKLSVKKLDNKLQLNFPEDPITQVENQPKLDKALGVKSIETWKGKTDTMIVLSSEEEVESLNPDFRTLKEIESRGIIVTAPGSEVDFVSRFFAPQSGIDEDPVTGSAHTTMTPYWANKTNKPILDARQLSPRGGKLKCQVSGDRVLITGEARTYLIGEIFI